MRVKMIQCEKCNTFYDPSQHSRCPFCPVPGLAVSGTVGATIGTTPPPPPPPPGPGTVQQSGDDLPTLGRGQGTTPTPPPGRPASRGAAEGVTIGILHKEMKIDPVVGWLVCVEGKERGRDYRVYSDRNFIGRGETMKICIKGDETISRERHAEINFDSRHNAFYIAPGDGRGNTYLNDRPVLEARELKAWDLIELGETKLVFVPLCGPSFNWTDSLIKPSQG